MFSRLTTFNYGLLLVSATLNVVMVLLLSQANLRPVFNEETVRFATSAVTQNNDIHLTSFRSNPAITNFGFKVDPHNGYITNVNDPNCAVEKPAVVNGCGFTFAPFHLNRSDETQVTRIKSIEFVSNLPKNNKLYVDLVSLKTNEDIKELPTITNPNTATITREMLGRSFEKDDAFYVRFTSPNGPTNISQIVIRF